MAATDDRLLEELQRAVMAADPIPDELRLSARSAIAYLRMDAALLELAHDSAVEGELAGVRHGGGGPRTLTFGPQDGSSEIGLELEVTGSGDARRLVGQVIPGGPKSVRVHVRGEQEPFTAEADEVGMFIIGDVPAGLVAVEVVAAEDRTVRSGWVAL